MLEELKEEVCRFNRRLPDDGLVTWTSGNVSGRDPRTGLVAIKPSGVKFEDLSPDKLTVVDLDGKVVEGSLAPSVDTPTHLVIYRGREDVRGVVHTHSNYATAFAAAGRPIPAVLTAMGDEFGGPIPLGAYCQIGEKEIGREVVKSIGASPAILMQNHGVFTVGDCVAAAYKAAVMTEDVARTVWLTMQLGDPVPIPAEEIARLRRRYVEKYGQ